MIPGAGRKRGVVHIARCPICRKRLYVYRLPPIAPPHADKRGAVCPMSGKEIS